MKNFFHWQNFVSLVRGASGHVGARRGATGRDKARRGAAGRDRVLKSRLGSMGIRRDTQICKEENLWCVVAYL